VTGKMYQEGDRLPSGRKVEEVALACEQWWDAKGRYLVPASFNQNQAAPKVIAARAGAPSIIIRAAKVRELPDGILDGAVWADLKGFEKAKVMAAYEVYQMSEAGQKLAAQQDAAKKLPAVVLKRA
jgi:hypothetical protein